MSLRFPRISPLANRCAIRKRLRPPIPSFSICLVKPPPRPSTRLHEEDRLEWLHALLSDTASLPDWLASQLKQQPMLFIGCEIPDWIKLSLLRMLSNTRAVA